MTTVRDKRIIVTGGANGIGFHYCHQLLLHGAKNIAILDLPNSNGQEAANKLNKEFGDKRAFFFPSDVTKHEEFNGSCNFSRGVVFGKAVQALGGLDILINNAGILNDATWEKMIDINFTGLVNATLQGYDFMGKHKGGKGGVIVNISSIVGLIQIGPLPVYTATKHAVMGFTVTLKKHYERTGISVRIMCPGVTDTPLITDSRHKYLNFVDSQKAFEEMLEMPRQPAENVGKAMIELIENGSNGSVWVSQNSEPPIEIELAKYESIKL